MWWMTAVSWNVSSPHLTMEQISTKPAAFGSVGLLPWRAGATETVDQKFVYVGLTGPGKADGWVHSPRDGKWISNV